MSAEAHYARHLGNFYAWMLGDFQEKQQEQARLFREKGLLPALTRKAIDFGAGNGLQTVALAELGYEVRAVDFNDQLLAELQERTQDLPVTVEKGDLRDVTRHQSFAPELVVCCGDTLPHLASKEEIRQWIDDVYTILPEGGKLLLTFRDYSQELTDTQRFLPVRQDDTRIHTCILEYFPEKVRVTDQVYEREGDRWVQKISSYEKVRVTRARIIGYLLDAGFTILEDDTIQRLVWVVAKK
ncbi:Methyltransferase domain-containing protein [Catalinimonas alkaloidigena]|uniref:Methyltransferase domain-containing protein n=1 Tax=Catalinimonas alkaloidigena TaxID=1075417 RepID=A0A1G9R3I1_9BACT|nr:methyltransferase domain-containing protein [Catalinimonas alkaloidigena]SDM17773.1 Methyltransferase domain-containing protein [Catalinimonas alkaloidigena]